MMIKGSVTKGSGEGSYFLMKEGYTKQFREKLGFIPYPGTLNIKARVKLPDNPICVIEGFSEDGKTYGEVLCYKARLRYKVRETECFVIRPALARDDGIIELIHEMSLREMLGLKDEDEVEIEI